MLQYSDWEWWEIALREKKKKKELKKKQNLK